MVLGALLEKDEAMALEIERGGQLQTVTVKPDARRLPKCGSSA
jgi:hypothetical protein